MGGGQDLEQDLLSMYPDILDTKRVCEPLAIWLHAWFLWVCVFLVHSHCVCHWCIQLMFCIINIIRRVFCVWSFALQSHVLKPSPSFLVADKDEAFISPNSLFNLLECLSSLRLLSFTTDKECTAIEIQAAVSRHQHNNVHVPLKRQAHCWFISESKVFWTCI